MHRSELVWNQNCSTVEEEEQRRRRRTQGVMVMDIWHKMIVPVRRVWLALYARLKHRKNGVGLLKLQDDVQTCEYQDVQVMWEMLQRTEGELIEDQQKRKQQPFWRIFVWSSNHNEASSESANHS